MQTFSCEINKLFLYAIIIILNKYKMVKYREIPFSKCKTSYICMHFIIYVCIYYITKRQFSIMNFTK